MPDQPVPRVPHRPSPRLIVEVNDRDRCLTLENLEAIASYLANIAKPNSALEIHAGEARPISLTDLQRVHPEERRAVSLLQDTSYSFIHVHLNNLGHVEIRYDRDDRPAADVAGQICRYVKGLSGRSTWQRRALRPLMAAQAFLVILMIGVNVGLMIAGKSLYGLVASGISLVGTAVLLGWMRYLDSRSKRIGVDPYTEEEIARRPPASHNWTRTGALAALFGALVAIVFGVLALRNS